MDVGEEESRTYAARNDEPADDAIPNPPKIHRFDLQVEDLGFETPPPCKTSMKFFEGSGRWSVFVLTETAKLEAVIDWLKEHTAPTSVQVSSNLAPRVARLEYDVLPERLSDLLSTNRVQNLCMFSEGLATVLAQGRPEAVEPVVPRRSVRDPVSLQGRYPHEAVDPVKTNLTNRQKQALSLAVAMGYYEVPHHVGLREIAGKMDMGLGSLSELLRRAEATVIRKHVDSLVEAEWEGVKTQVENIKSGKVIKRD